MPLKILLLQGPSSPFFSALAAALSKRGHFTYQAIFCGGDMAYASAEAHRLEFMGELEELPDWYKKVISKHQITDVLLFGDCRPIHYPIHAICLAQRLKVHVFEEGYVRPYWMTMERHGVNGRSLMSKDPSLLKEGGTQIPPMPAAYATGYSVSVRAYHDIRYRIFNALLKSRFPKYASHRPHNGLVEYAGLASQLFIQRFSKKRDNATIQSLIASRSAFFFLPLQLEHDTQLTSHSRFGKMSRAIPEILESFAQFAPPDTFLLIKAHPLDTGIINNSALSERLAAKLGIAERVIVVKNGHLPTIFDHCKGVVVINSTVGLSAIHHRKPTIALGSAIYDIEGLTSQSNLDEFWNNLAYPDMELYYRFLDYIVHQSQINGDFYTASGVAMAVPAVISRLEANAD